MKESAAIGAADPASTGARQRTQAAREKWEESWITQQRAVTAVIAGESRQQSTQIDAAMSRPSPKDQEVLRHPAGSSQRQVPSPSFVEIDASADSEHGTRLRRPTPNCYSSAIGGAQLQVPTKERATAIDTQQASARSAAMPREQGKSFAFWRDGQALDVAMRLQDPEKTSASIIAQLRQWLRGTDSKLRSVVINGRLAWRDQEPPTRG